MWYPNRERKISEIIERNKKTGIENSSLALEERKKIKKEFFDKYIKDS